MVYLLVSSVQQCWLQRQHGLAGAPNCDVKLLISGVQVLKNYCLIQTVFKSKIAYVKAVRKFPTVPQSQLMLQTHQKSSLSK